jgi:putative peptidoglycan lipid II flippase
VKQRSVARAAVGMGGVTAVSRVAGFARVLVIAGVLGTTYLGNTFQAANSVSNVLFELLAAGALSAVLVPTFVSLIDTGDDREAERLANGLLGYALVAMASSRRSASRCRRCSPGSCQVAPRTRT